MKRFLQILIATELTVVLGVTCVAWMISAGSGFKTPFTWDLVVAIFLVAFPIVNLVTLLLFWPMDRVGMFKMPPVWFVIAGPFLGGGLYCFLVAAILGCFTGERNLGFFFFSGPAVFTFLVGAIFGGLFSLSYLAVGAVFQRFNSLP